MTFLIRPATMADLDVLTEIEARGFPPEEKASRERFEERLKAFGAHFLILEDAGKPIGLIDGMVTDSEKIVDEMFEDATIHNPKGAWQSIFGLCVLPEYRRQGGAAMLMNALLRRHAKKGERGSFSRVKRPLFLTTASLGTSRLAFRPRCMVAQCGTT